MTNGIWRFWMSVSRRDVRLMFVLMFSLKGIYSFDRQPISANQDQGAQAKPLPVGEVIWPRDPELAPIHEASLAVLRNDNQLRT